MAKKLLLIRVTQDYPEEVVTHIKSIAGLAGVNIEDVSLTDLARFEAEVCNRGPYDFVYLAAHGSHSCFGENEPSITFRWADFGLVLCRTAVMKEESILFLGCCHGGFKKVALSLFNNCDNIASVCGLRWSGTTDEFLVAFHTFLFNFCTYNEEPEEAARRASSAIGRSLPFYSRYDFEAELTTIRQFAESANPDLFPDELIVNCPVCHQPAVSLSLADNT